MWKTKHDCQPKAGEETHHRSFHNSSSMRGSVHSSQFRKKRGTTHVMMNSIDVSLNYSCEKFVEREKKEKRFMIRQTVPLGRNLLSLPPKIQLSSIDSFFLPLVPQALHRSMRGSMNRKN
jgi:hypothetical protein